MSRGRYLTFAQAAGEFPFTEKALRQLVDKRRLPHHKVGRRVLLAAADIEALIEAGRVEAVRPRRPSTTKAPA